MCQDSSAGKKRNPIGLFLVWSLLVAVFAVCCVISFSVVMEDAFISFRYAENVASGCGPVFNRGEEPVEGFSNPSWVALLSLFSLLGFDTPGTARLLGILFGALVLLEVLLIFRLMPPDWVRYGPAAAFVVASMPVFVFWAAAGLENSLYCWLLFLSYRLVLQEINEPNRFSLSAFTVFLLSVTRPEGILFFAAFAVWKLIEAVRTGAYSFRRFLVWAGTVLLLFGVFEAWRYQTFGMLVPNTFFAKVNNGLRVKARLGAAYIWSCLNHTLWLPLLVPSWLALRFRNTNLDARSQAVRGALLLAATQVLFLVYAGGDIHPMDRFCLPVLLTTAVLVFLLMPPWGNQTSRLSAIVLFVMLMGNLAYSCPPARRIEPPMIRPPNLLTANLAALITGRLTLSDCWQRFVSPPHDSFELVGLDLADDPLVSGLLAADQCGKIPYWSKMETLDLLGLNDKSIALTVHSMQPWEVYAEKVLEKSPDVFVVAYRDGVLVSRYYLENTVMSKPFQDRYVMDAIYSAGYRFFDTAGQSRRFGLEFIRFVSRSGRQRMSLSEEDRKWFSENQPIVDDPAGLRRMVETFRTEHAGEPGRIIEFETSLN